MKHFLRVFLLIAFILIFPERLVAFDVLEVKSPIGKMALANAFYWLEDPDNTLTIEEISKIPANNQFTKSEKGSLDQGFSQSTYWLRFDFKKGSDAPEEYILEINFPLLDHLEFYSQDGDSFTKQVTGDNFPFSQRAYGYRHYSFPISLSEAHSRTFFLKVKSSSSIRFTPSLWEKDEFFSNVTVSEALNGIYYGSIFVMLFYNFFLWIIFLERPYFYYCIFILFFGLSQATLNGHTFQFFWPNSPAFGNMCLSIFMAMGVFWAFHFSRSYLRTRQNTPGLDKVLFMLAAFAGAIGILSPFIGYSFSIKLTVIMAASAMLLLVTGGICLARGYIPAKYFLIAWFVFLNGVAAQAFAAFGLIEGNFFTNWGAQIGSFFEIVLLSLGLAYRVKLQKRETFAAQEKAILSMREAENAAHMLAEEKERAQCLEEQTRAKELSDVAERLISNTAAPLQRIQRFIDNTSLSTPLTDPTACKEATTLLSTIKKQLKTVENEMKSLDSATALARSTPPSLEG